MTDAIICFLCVTAALLGIVALYMIERNERRRIKWFERELNKAKARCERLRDEENPLDYVLAYQEYRTLYRAMTLEDDDHD